MRPTGQIIGEVNVKHCSGRYMDEFIRLKCTPDLLLMGVFPNAKEITESMAAFRATQRYISRFDMRDPSVTVYCVGDGCTPRTGALFAYRTAWSVISIDPALKDKGKWAGIERLSCVREKVEDVGKFGISKKALIVAVHSHADLTEAYRKLCSEDTAIIALPCCVPQKLFEIEPDYDFQDFGIWSPKRRVLIWENV